MWGVDAHTASWISAVEAAEVEKWYQKLRNMNVYERLWGYVLGNSIDCCKTYPDEANCADVRIIFWFDN